MSSTFVYPTFDHYYHSMSILAQSLGLPLNFLLPPPNSYLIQQHSHFSFNKYCYEDALQPSAQLSYAESLMYSGRRVNRYGVIGEKVKHIRKEEVLAATVATPVVHKKKEKHIGDNDNAGKKNQDRVDDGEEEEFWYACSRNKKFNKKSWRNTSLTKKTKKSPKSNKNKNRTYD